MAWDRMALLEQLGNAAASGDLDLLRQSVKAMAEALMELEVSAQHGADPHQRTAERTGYRHGHCPATGTPWQAPSSSQSRAPIVAATSRAGGSSPAGEPSGRSWPWSRRRTSRCLDAQGRCARADPGHGGHPWTGSCGRSWRGLSGSVLARRTDVVGIFPNLDARSGAAALSPPSSMTRGSPTSFAICPRRLSHASSMAHRSSPSATSRAWPCE